MGDIQVDSLGVGLCRSGGAGGDIDVDPQWPHEVHSNEDGWSFEPHDDEEGGAAPSFAPLQVEMLASAGDLQGFAMGAADNSLIRLQGTPLGVVLPPDCKAHAGDRGPCIHKAEDRDAF